MTRRSSASPSTFPAADSKASKAVAAGDRAERTGVRREPIAMKPRPRLFAALLIVFAIWVMILVAMYVTMVRSRPQPRRPAVAPSQAEAAPEKTMRAFRY